MQIERTLWIDAFVDAEEPSGPFLGTRECPQ